MIIDADMAEATSSAKIEVNTEDISGLSDQVSIVLKMLWLSLAYAMSCVTSELLSLAGSDLSKVDS